MAQFSTTRYPSLAMARPNSAGAESPGADSAAVTVDGLEVVDEQVVVLAPAPPRPGRARSRRRSWDQGGDDALG
jgi:hypothetical protein